MDVWVTLHEDLVCFPGRVCLEQRRGGILPHDGGSHKSQRIIDSCWRTGFWRTFVGIVGSGAGWHEKVVFAVWPQFRIIVKRKMIL